MQRNYLDVYIYEKWNTKEIPEFREGEEFIPSVCELKEGETSSPSLLTEADLVTLMDKNGIGEHVSLHNLNGYLKILLKGLTQQSRNTYKPSSTANTSSNASKERPNISYLQRWVLV